MVAIGEAARRSGVGIETIRYYERKGIVPPAPRTASGRRSYGAAQVAALRIIRQGRALGFPLRDAAELARLAEGRANACAAAQDLGDRQLSHVRAKIADLRAIEAALVALTRDCDGRAGACPALGRLAQGAANGIVPNSHTASGTGATASAVTATKRGTE